MNGGSLADDRGDGRNNWMDGGLMEVIKCLEMIKDGGVVMFLGGELE